MSSASSRQLDNLVVDADGHAVEDYEGFCSFLEPEFHSLAPQFETNSDGSVRLLRLEGRPWQPDFAFVPTDAMLERQQRIGPAATDASERIRMLDEEGIDVSVVFPSLGLYFGLFRNPKIAAAMCRAENRWLSRWCNQAPDRLAAMAVLPQQDPDLAAAELVRAVEQDGAVGGMVRPNPCGGSRVDIGSFDPLWRAAVALNVPVVFHEGWVGGGYPTLGSDRAQSYAAAHAMSHPFEAMAAILSVVQTGLLSRFPALRLGFFEAGCGWAPWWTSRISAHAALKPSEFPMGVPTLSSRIWLSFDPTEPVEDLMARHGWASNICFASDFPHADATYPGAVAEVRAQGLPPELERQVLGGNAINLFGPHLCARLNGNAPAHSGIRTGATRTFLVARGAAAVGHSHKTLMRHLEATSELLRIWSARQVLCDVGLFHSVYGSDAFTTAIATDWDRVAVRNLIGAEAEELVWLFCRCSQQSIVDAAAWGGPLLDRFDGQELLVSREQYQDLCEIVVANWLEQRPRLDGDRQHQLLDAVEQLVPYVSMGARAAIKLARMVEADHQSLRRWVAHSHRVVTLTIGGNTSPLPTFEPEDVLASPKAVEAFQAIAEWLRRSRWDNTTTEHLATRLALREPVAADAVVEWLGASSVEALHAVNALQWTDHNSGRVTLAVGMLFIGNEVVLVPADGKRRDGVYFGLEPLLLNMLAHAVAPQAVRVFECGAGAGLASILAARQAFSVASDVLHRASSYVTLTRTLNLHLNPNLHAVTADGASGFAHACFSLILMNPPLVPGVDPASQPVYAYGGPTGTELPLRLLRDSLPLLEQNGCLVMVTLDYTLQGGKRPLIEALANLGDGYIFDVWISPWQFFAPNAIPRLLAHHGAVLADAQHVGVVIIRIGSEGERAARRRLRNAIVALSGSGWTARSIDDSTD